MMMMIKLFLFFLSFCWYFRYRWIYGWHAYVGVYKPECRKVCKVGLAVCLLHFSNILLQIYNLLFTIQMLEQAKRILHTFSKTSKHIQMNRRMCVANEPIKSRPLPRKQIVTYLREFVILSFLSYL